MRSIVPPRVVWETGSRQEISITRSGHTNLPDHGGAIPSLTLQDGRLVLSQSADTHVLDLRPLHPVRSGSVLVAGSGLTDAEVCFDRPFPGTPVVTLTAQSAGADPHLTGVTKAGFSFLHNLTGELLFQRALAPDGTAWRDRVRITPAASHDLVIWSALDHGTVSRTLTEDGIAVTMGRDATPPAGHESRFVR